MSKAPKSIKMYDLIWSNGKNKETVVFNKPYPICKTIQKEKLRTHRGGSWKFQAVKH